MQGHRVHFGAMALVVVLAANADDTRAPVVVTATSASLNRTVFHSGMGVPCIRTPALVATDSGALLASPESGVCGHLLYMCRWPAAC